MGSPAVLLARESARLDGARRLLPAACVLLSAACGGYDPSTIGDYPHAAETAADAGSQLAPPQGTGGADNASDASTVVPGVPGDAGSATGSGPYQLDACQEHVAQGASATPDMLIVLDRSGSMNPDNNDQMSDRWGGSRSALQQVTAAFDDRVNFGLMTFPGPGSGGGGRGQDNCSTGVLNVPVGPNTGEAIGMTLQGMNAEGRTPTTLALQEALRVLGAVMTGPDQLTIPKYVLLVTDGDPNCSGMAGSRNVDDVARTQTIAAIDALRMAGIKTFVVGYQTASSSFVDQLDRMAQAGGTGATSHRSVENGDDLAATVAELAKKAVSCSYQLEAAVADPTRVLVSVGATPRNRAQADGWQLEADNRTVTLLGGACEELQQGKVFKVEVKCEPLPIF
jgi:Mg-chelatase subunit ChlD